MKGVDFSKKEWKEINKKRDLQGIKSYIHYSIRKINLYLLILTDKIKTMDWKMLISYYQHKMALQLLLHSIHYQKAWISVVLFCFLLTEPSECAGDGKIRKVTHFGV